MMKSIKEITNMRVKMMGQLTDLECTQSGYSLSEKDAIFVNKLFKELEAIFPAYSQILSTQKKEGDTKKSWVKGLYEAGIFTDKEIQLGLKRARASGETFLPSVGRFCKWCAPLPEDVGLPSIEKAFKYAINNHKFLVASLWTHPAIYVAASSLSNQVFLSSKQDKTFKAFEEAYLCAIKRVFSGEDLTSEMPKESPQLEVTTSKPEFVKTEAAKIKEKLKRNKAYKVIGNSNLATSFYRV